MEKDERGKGGQGTIYEPRRWHGHRNGAEVLSLNKSPTVPL